MEVPDTTVRVLYDFEYETKDGRKIKIKYDEKLFLIKKTNNDWWQVIRSFERRPFYVPASYVEEIQRNKVASTSSDGSDYKFKKNIAVTNLEIESDNFLQHQSLQHLKSASADPLLHSEKAYRNRSFSLEDKRVSNYTSKEKVSIANKTHFGTLSSSGYESLSEIGLPGVLEQNAATEIDYVNLRKENEGFIVEEVDALPVASEYEAVVNNSGEQAINDKKNLLSDTDNSVQPTISNQLNEVEIDNSEIGNYSNVSCVSESIENQKLASVESDLVAKLPLSSSLEELSQQIELKTSKLRKCPDFTKIFNLSEDSLVDRNSNESEVSKVMFAPTKSNSVVDVATKVKNLNKIEDPSLNIAGFSKKLQYAGSFKTKLERQKWAKQHFDNSSLKHAEDDQMKSIIQGNIREESCAKNVTSIDINFSEEQRKTVAVPESLEVEGSVQKETKCISNKKNHKDGMAVKQKSGSRQSLDSIVEDEGIIESKKKSNQYHEDKCMDTSIKSVDIKSIDVLQSDKGSTDSLLDIDKHYNSRKVSIGTTSEGEDLCLENSDSETDSIILGMTRLKNSADDIRKQKRRVSLTRNRRVDSCKSRQYPMQAPPSPTPAQIPTKTLSDGWNEYITDDGRKYFFNTQSRAKSWKPPRRRYNSNEEKQDENGSTGNLYSGSSSPLGEVDGIFTNFPLPAGWHTEIDSETGLPCYISIASGAKVRRTLYMCMW